MLEAALDSSKAESAHLAEDLQTEVNRRLRETAELGAQLMAAEEASDAHQASAAARARADEAENARLRSALERARRDAAELHAAALRHVEEGESASESGKGLELSRLERECAARRQEAEDRLREGSAAAEARHRAEAESHAQRRARLMAWAVRAASKAPGESAAGGGGGGSAEYSSVAPVTASSVAAAAAALTAAAAAHKAEAEAAEKGGVGAVPALAPFQVRAGSASVAPQGRKSGGGSESEDSPVAPRFPHAIPAGTM